MLKDCDKFWTYIRKNPKLAREHLSSTFEDIKEMMSKYEYKPIRDSIDDCFNRLDVDKLKFFTRSDKNYYQDLKRTFLQKPPHFLYMYVPAEFALDTIQGEYIYFRDPRLFKNNDVSFEKLLNRDGFNFSFVDNLFRVLIDSNSEYSDELRGEVHKYSELINGVCTCLVCGCLTTAYNDERCWKEHAIEKGVCIKIDTTKLDIRPVKVYYGKGKNGLLLKAFQFQLIHYLKSMSRTLFYLAILETIFGIYSKPPSVYWEKEWRLIIHTIKENTHYSVKGAFSEVYVTTKCDSDFYLNVERECIKKNIPFKVL